MLRWLVALAASVPLLAGCSTLNMLSGSSLLGDEDDLGIVTRPYPGWESKAKETIDRIPTAEPKMESASAPKSPIVGTAVAAAPRATNVNATVTQEQPPVSSPASNPAVTAPPAAATSPAAPPAVHPKATPEMVTPAAASESPTTAAAPVSPATLIAPDLVLPTHEKPLVIGSPTPQTQSQPLSANQKDPEPTPAERLTALIKQRSEFLTALKAEVDRRRNATADDEELARLEQELRLVQLAGEQPEEAVREIESLDPSERDAFAHLLMGLATWMNADEARRPTLRNAKIVREIRDAAAELAAASKLDVRNLAFCEKVESYGWYTEFPRRQFKSKQQVILYAEVENFTAVRISEESFETELQGSYQIFDSRGNLVDERELPLDKEVCRNYRRDYFLAYLIYLPEGLSPGSYRLELTIEDKKGAAARQETPRQDKTANHLAKTTEPSSAAYKGRKLGTGTIEFSIK